MNKTIKTIVFLLLTTSAQNYYSQSNQKTNSGNSENLLQFKADNIKNNKLTKVSIYTGNVSLDSPSIHFDSAEKMIYNTQAHTIEIYNPKSYKVDHLNALIKKADAKDSTFILYNVKENTISL